MKNRLTIIITILLLAALSTSAIASNGTQIGTIGAKAISMASCFRGLADDWSAAYFNPAGLVQLNGKLILGASMGLIMPRGSYTPYAYPATTLPSAGLYTNQRDAVDRNFFVPSFGLFYKPSDNLIFGVAVYAPFGLGTEWDLYHIPDGYGNANAMSKQNEHYSDHQVINIQPTIAIKVSDRISVGLGLSYIWGKMVLDQVKAVPHPILDPAYQQIYAALGPLQATHYRFYAENQLEGDGTSFGANLGILIKMSDKLSLGVSGRYASDLKLKGNLTQTYGFPLDAAKIQTLQQLQALGVITAEESLQLQALFSGQTITAIDDAEAEASLPLPMTLGAGLAYKASDRLTLTADASWTNWASWDIIALKGDGFDDLEMKENWVNTLEIGGGFELLAMNRVNKQFFVRGGFYTVDTPVPNATISPTILDPNRRFVVTGGFGLNMGKVKINLSGEYVMFNEKDIPAASYVFDNSAIAENYAGVYNFNALVISLDTQISLH